MFSRKLWRLSYLLLLAVTVSWVGCSDEEVSLTAPTLVADQATDQTSQRPEPKLESKGYGSSWPYYSQSQRNYLLLNVGYGDISRYGGQCKVWVQNLVAKVTDWRVRVPTNVCNSCYSRYLWNSDPYGHVSGQSMNIRYVQPGQVVQMAWGSTQLHTFILAGRTTSGMYWLDSNWGKDGRVRYHYVSNSYFNSLPNLRYSVYTIGW